MEKVMFLVVFVCFMCVSVSRITAKVVSQFQRNAVWYILSPEFKYF